MLIEDPLNLRNNVARNCFRVKQIQRAFASASRAEGGPERGPALGWSLGRVEASQAS